MSRSGYDDDCNGWDLIRWRGAVKSAVKGERGQALLRSMLAALDAMPNKRLIENALVTPDGECCALGAVALSRSLDVSGVDPDDRDQVADLFSIAPALVAEIAHVNDRDLPSYVTKETPEQRFVRVRAWIVEQIGNDQ